jgi:hypothetical protein
VQCTKSFAVGGTTKESAAKQPKKTLQVRKARR